MFNDNQLAQIISKKILTCAFHHVYHKRKTNGPNSDIWDLALNWHTKIHEIQKLLLTGKYRLSPLMVFKTDQGYMTRWSSMDALVLKAISMVLTPIIQQHLSKCCYHIKDNGGLKGAVRDVRLTLKQALKNHPKEQYKYVIKSDVKSFYESMDHDVLMTQVKAIIKDQRLTDIIQQYITRCEVLNGEHQLITRGIPRGCPLSPLMGAIALKPLDDAMPENVFYARYMDDWVVLVKNRFQFRRLVKTMHQVMEKLKFKLAPDKTFIGKIERGFDFLGYRFTTIRSEARHVDLMLAKKTIQNFLNKRAKLYEQRVDYQRVAAYEKRWFQWVTAGLTTHKKHRCRDPLAILSYYIQQVTLSALMLFNSVGIPGKYMLYCL